MFFSLFKIMKNIVRPRHQLATGAKVDNSNYIRPFRDIPKPNVSLLSKWFKWLSERRQPQDIMDSVDHFEKGDGIVIVQQNPFTDPYVFLTDPSFCKDMYIRGIDPRMPIRQAIVAREYYFRSREMIALSVSHGKNWRKVRSAIGPLLLEDQFTKHYRKPIVDTATEFVDVINSIRNKITFQLPDDFYNAVQRWCLETLFLVTLNHKLGCLDLNQPRDSVGYKVHETHLHLFHQMHILEDSLMWRYWPTASRRKFYRDMDFIMNIIKGLIDNRKRERERALQADNDGNKALVDFLLQQEIHVKDATTLIADLLSGGIETVANTVITTLYALAINPDAQHKLRNEIDAARSEDDAILFDERKHLKYLKACLHESMRLLPVIPANTRTLQEDTLIGQYEVPKGTTVVAAHGLMGLMNKYFEEPRQFRPERWLGNSKPHPFAILPFGHGARMCVAKRLADQMMEILLATMIQKYHFTWTGGPLQMKYQLHRQIQPPLKFLCLNRIENTKQ